VKLYFITSNRRKIAEAEHYMAWRHITEREHIELCCVAQDVQEILHSDIEKIVRQKVVDAIAQIGHPCIVEHGGLFMDALPGLPGGLGRLVWDAVQDRMCGFLRSDDSREASARSYLGYCDGRRVRVYMGETRGCIADRARGDYKFAWDQIFVPGNEARTYGEMGLELKRETSPVYKAWDAFITGERAGFTELG
jgi:XTP/dITP diphosphohydrolase